MILSKEFVNSYKNKPVPWGFDALSYVTYKRTYARLTDKGKLEEWHETIARCIEGAQEIGADYTKEEAEKLFDYIFNLKGTYGGRFLWQLGTKLGKQYGDSLCNCWSLPITKWEDFLFVFHELLLGGREYLHCRR